MRVALVVSLSAIVFTASALKYHYKGRIPNPKLCSPTECSKDADCKAKECPENYLSSPQCVIYSFPARSCCQCFVNTSTSPNDEKRIIKANARYSTECPIFRHSCMRHDHGTIVCAEISDTPFKCKSRHEESEEDVERR